MTEAEARLDFKVAVLAVDQRCLVHDNPDDCSGDLQAHHVITQQQLRKAGRDDLRWSPKNGMAICDRAHDRHHSAHERIPLARVPARCIAFAEQHGFDLVLARYYATDEA